MAFLGFVLVAAAVALAVGIALDNGGEATLSVFGQTVPGVSTQWQVFFAGAVVAVIFIAGLMITFMGLGRMMRTRRDLRSLREEHQESLTTLQMEKQQLQRELARIRRDSTSPASPASSSSVSSAPSASSGDATPPPLPSRRPLVTGNSPFFDRND